jgi:hypothetical protein
VFLFEKRKDFFLKELWCEKRASEENEKLCIKNKKMEQCFWHQLMPLLPFPQAHKLTKIV